MSGTVCPGLTVTVVEPCVIVYGSLSGASSLDDDPASASSAGDVVAAGESVVVVVVSVVVAVPLVVWRAVSSVDSPSPHAAMPSVRVAAVASARPRAMVLLPVNECLMGPR